MKLKWALVELKKNGSQPFHLSGYADLSQDLKKAHSELIEVSLIHIDGYLTLENDDQLLVSLQLDYVLTLPSTRSLEPVELKMRVPMTEIYLSPHAPKADVDDELVFRLEYDWIDLKKPIIETILISIPLQVLTEEEKLGKQSMPTGKGWQVLSEEDYERQINEVTDDQEIDNNSPFSVLKDYFENTKENR